HAFHFDSATEKSDYLEKLATQFAAAAERNERLMLDADGIGRKNPKVFVREIDDRLARTTSQGFGLLQAPHSEAVTASRAVKRLDSRRNGCWQRGRNRVRSTIHRIPSIRKGAALRI